MHGYRDKNTVRPVIRLLLGAILLSLFYAILKMFLTAPWLIKEQILIISVSTIAMIFIGYLCLFGHVPRCVIKISIKANKAERKLCNKLKAVFKKSVF